MRNAWSEEWMLDERQREPVPSRNTDSSVDAQYEDSVLPDRNEGHEGESEVVASGA